MSDSSQHFTKDNLDTYLKALAKEYRKRNGKAVPAEIILIGGAAVLAGYGFRNMTTDVDAVIHAASSMKDAINQVGDAYGLPNGWLNNDFMETASYSPRLDEFSEYYRTYSHVLQIRIVSAEYLVAMKLRSGRKYKNDLSDIMGILAEHEKRGASLSEQQIETAVINLYGSWDAIPEDSRTFLQNALRNGNYAAVYEQVKQEELHAKYILLDFQQDYPGVTNESNVNEILQALKKKKQNQ